MSKLRSVSTSFWSDPFIEELSTDEKLLYLYLITNDKTNMLGVYEVSIKKISFETGISQQTITKSIDRFKSKGKIQYIDNYIILLNYLKNQKFNTNMKKSAIEAYNELPKSLKFNDEHLNKDETDKSFANLLKGFGMVRKVEYESKVETKVELEAEFKNEVPKSKFSEAVFLCYDKVVGYFDLELQPKDEKKKDNWIDCIDKLNRIDGLSFEEIHDITKKARNDNFWKSNFLVLTKLRETDKQGIKHWIRFKNINSIQNGTQSQIKTPDHVSNGDGIDWEQEAINRSKFMNQ